MINPIGCAMRRAISAAIAMGVAVLVGHYYALSQAFMVTTTAILVMQTSIGTPLRQGLVRSLIVLLSVFVSSVLLMLLSNPTWVDILLVLLATIGFSLAADVEQQPSRLPITFMVAMVMMATLLVPFQSLDMLYARMYDVLLGAVLGVGAILFILPNRADVEFRHGVVPVLRAYSDFVSAIVKVLIEGESMLPAANQCRLDVEKVLQTQRASFPDWVYEAGFNPELQVGYRHFLVKLEQAGQILLMMHHTASARMHPALLDVMSLPMQDYAQQCKQLIDAMIVLLELKPLQHVVSDASDALGELERAFKKAVPVPLDLLDISKDNMQVAQLVYEWKDLRKTLLKLAEAIR